MQHESMEHSQSKRDSSTSWTELGPSERQCIDETARQLRDISSSHRASAVYEALHALAESLKQPLSFSGYMLSGVGRIASNSLYASFESFEVCVPDTYGRDTIKAARDSGAFFLPLRDGSIFVNNEYSLHLYRPDQDRGWKEEVLWATHPTVLQSTTSERCRVRQLRDGSVIALYGQKLHSWAKNSRGVWEHGGATDFRVRSFDVSVGSDVIAATPEGDVLKVSHSPNGQTSSHRLFRAVGCHLIRAAPERQVLVANSDGYIDMWGEADGRWHSPHVVSSAWDPTGACTVLPDGRIAYLSSKYPAVITVMRTEKPGQWRIDCEIDAYCANPRSIRALPGRQLLVHSESEVVLVKDSGNNRWISRKLVMVRDQISSVHVTEDGSLLVGIVPKVDISQGLRGGQRGLVTHVTIFRETRR